jgi:hypothetical protein
MKNQSVFGALSTHHRFFAGLVLAAALVCLFVVPPAGADPLKLNDHGRDKAFLKEVPWSGYWWSRQTGNLITGWKGQSESPFKRYDRFVQALTGTNPKSYEWERDPRNGHYDPQGPSWAGHCNGWAAAAILEPEPRAPRTVNGITFSVGDQKGLLSEMYMDCRTLFYGNRTNNPTILSNDIRPDLFHRLLIDNIKKRKRGIVADTSFTRSVWNYPIYGYETEWRTTWFWPSVLRVTTTVHFVDDNVRPDFVGVKTFTKTYHYLLNVNRRGEVTGGVWDPRSLWDHPDFVWVPTGDAPAAGGENPRIQPQYVHMITRGEGAGRPAVDFSGRPESLMLAAGVDTSAYFD